MDILIIKFSSDFLVHHSQHQELQERLGSKNKFPWMSYNQIKQTLLTSSDSNYEYLDDYLGWGVVNKRKALRGPSDFNAGLIDEQNILKAG